MKLKLNPNTVLILVILAMVLAANIINTLVASSSSDVASVQSISEATLPLNILDFIKIIIIFIMAWIGFSTIRRIVRHEKWNAKYYRSIKQVGWLSVLVVLLDAISFVIQEQYISQNKDLSAISTDVTIYTDIISHALFSSPIAWFLIACIFIFADVLEYVNNAPANS